MNIRSRLALLLGSLLLIFAAAIWAMRQAHEIEATGMLESIATERRAMLEQLLELNGQSLRTFATDYSMWTEMAVFLRTGERQWATVNIDASLPNFDAHAAWVLRADGRQHYAALRQLDESARELPFASPEFIAALLDRKMMHFFHQTRAGLLEIRTAPIQLSDDTARATPALGWLIVARLWDNTYVRQIAEPLQSTASWQPAPLKRPDEAHVRLRRDLADWNGQIARTLFLDYRPAALVDLLEGNYRETYLFFGFGLVVVIFTVAGVSAWVISPLHRLSQALELGRGESLNDLRQSRNEFGHLAQLVEQSFAQRDKLREAETNLRHALELRSRLARDLHDGIIQSIYAAGLGLEGVRSVLRTAPGLADERLAATQKALNDTIAEVRGFITGLEPEQAPSVRLSFSDALASLASTMESIQQFKIKVAVDQAVARTISPEQELHGLQVVREAVSNALRHAEARTIRVALGGDGAAGAVLEIADDGRGFDPAQHASEGRGLVNLAFRAREMGGTLRIDTAPGKGTRIALNFKPAFGPKS